MKIIKPSVQSLTPLAETPFLRTIEIAGRTCYKSEDKMTEGSAETFCANLIKRGHEAMLEHGQNISMRFTCDRGVSHEIVRHRLFSFAQESTRYCNYGKKNQVVFILPKWCEDDIQVGEYAIYGCPLNDSPSHIWFNQMLDAEQAYLQLLAGGWKPEQARSVLPNSLKTEIVVTGNIREWRHFFYLRTDVHAHPQMRQVANIAYELVTKDVPVLFDDITPYLD